MPPLELEPEFEDWTGVIMFLRVECFVDSLERPAHVKFQFTRGVIEIKIKRQLHHAPDTRKKRLAYDKTVSRGLRLKCFVVGKSDSAASRGRRSG
jgi:hypothetical protein